MMKNVKECIEQGAVIKAQKDEALIDAASSGHFDMVEYLLAHGANAYVS